MAIVQMVNNEETVTSNIYNPKEKEPLTICTTL